VVRFVCASDAFKQVLGLAFLVLLIAATIEDEYVGNVASKSEACRDKHELTIDIGGV
jgi:hypothetical protein